MDARNRREIEVPRRDHFTEADCFYPVKNMLGTYRALEGWYQFAAVELGSGIA